MIATSPVDLVVGEKSSWFGGACCTLLGSAVIYMGYQAFDPDFMARGPSILKFLFRLVEGFSPPVRSSIIIGIGALVLGVGGILLYSSIWPDRRLVIDKEGIETFGGGAGRLAWNNIASVSQVGKLLAFTSVDGRKILGADTSEINKSVRQIHAAIGRYRPDLVPAAA